MTGDRFPLHVRKLAAPFLGLDEASFDDHVRKMFADLSEACSSGATDFDDYCGRLDPVLAEIALAVRSMRAAMVGTMGTA